MDISEHLNELRARMIKALIGIAIALVICLLYQDNIMWIITGPHRQAMDNLKKEIVNNSVTQPKEGKLTDEREE